MVKLKICGIRRKEDVDIVNKYSIDYVGLVFAESPRKVSKDKAKYLSSLLKEDITSVGVFVNEDIDFIVDLYVSNIISIAQLHGDEDEEYIKSLKKKSLDKTGEEIKIIKSIEINDSFINRSINSCNNRNINGIIKEINSLSDYFLFDSGKGSGKVFNWDLIDKDTISKKPFFLAGGLNCSNLELAIGEFEPFAVDLSSGVEINKFKDDFKIKEVVDIVKKC